MLNKLITMLKTLRGPRGCNWDKKQTLGSLKKYLLEECYELIDTLENFETDPTHQSICAHKEELGDVLFQVIFQAQIQTEKDNFNLQDVIKNLENKITRRHPHIFGDADYDPDHQENPYWEKIKSQEHNWNNPFHTISQSQPNLNRAKKLGQKAELFDFDWSDLEPIFVKLEEEIRELKEEIKNKNIKNQEYELGDILFCVAQIARKLKLDPELALRAGNKKFEKRFLYMISQAANQESFKKLSPEQKQNLWNNAKKKN